MKIRTIKQYTAGILAALLLAMTGMFSAVVPAYAAQNVFQGCDGASDSTVCNNKSDDAKPMITAVINTILLILGIIAVLMIIIGGIRYTISGGDSGSVQSAKNTILYAVVGLVIAMLAFAIVNFVIARLK
jgi:cytochrome bd-type quinol oxidase subunit 2